MGPVPDVAAWFASTARRYPGRCAVADGDTQLTFAELSNQADRLGDALLQLGVRFADRVGLLGRNAAWFLVSYFALARIGACAVLLNVRWVATEIAYALRDTGAVGLIYDEALSEVVDRVAPEARIPVMVSSAARPSIVGSLGLSGLVARGSARGPGAAGAVSADTPLMILYTSGTTGFPKGAILSHGNIAWATFGVISDNAYGREGLGGRGRGGGRFRGRALVSLPLYHVAGLQLQALPHLLSGGSVVLTGSSNPVQAAELARRCGATSMYLLRFQWKRLAEEVFGGGLKRGAAEPFRLRQLIIGGGAVDPEIFALGEWLGAEFTFTMGMTETGPQVFRMAGAELRRDNGALGRPRWYIDVDLLDDGGRPVSACEVGELAVRGPTVFRGYHGASAGQSASFRNGWFLTGDLLRRRDDGVYVYVERKKDMIRSGGENVYAAEVERVLCSLPEVADAAVIGVPHPQWGETVKAFVVLREGRSTTADSIVAAARAQLAGYKCPRLLEFVGSLPKTDLGRVKKAELRGRSA